jgi:hypothetical protein
MDAYLSDLLSFWPWLLAALLFAEVSAYCASRRLFQLQISIGAVAFVVLLVFQYAKQSTPYAVQTRPYAYFLVWAWVTAVPLATLTLGAALLARIPSTAWRQVGLAVLSLGVTVALPWFMLLSVCASGFDCI